MLLVVDVLFAAAALVTWIWFDGALREAWADRSAWSGIIVLNAALLAYRGAATVDSFFQSVARGTRDWAGGLVAAALLVFPHLLIGSLAVTQDDAVDGATAGSPPVAPATSLTTTTTTTTTTTLPLVTTTTAPPRIWDGYERVNIMLLGSDAGVGRTGTRTDTVILVSIEPETGDVAMISIPRNLTEAPLPEGMGIWECNCFPDIITHLWANGEWYPDAFPGPQAPSVNALKAALGLIFGIDIHYYAKVDLAGFVAMIDAIGGVTIDVPKRIVDESYPHENGGTEYIVIEEGPQLLDGHRALVYARSRRHSGDFARMHRQRCLLGALIQQADVSDLVAGFGEFTAAVRDHVETDIPIDRLGDFVELLSRVDIDRVATLRITRYNYGSSGHAGYQLYDLERIKADTLALMEDPTTHLDTQDGEGFEATCELSFD